MKIINFADIKALNISPVRCYEWAEEMIAHKKNAILPPKTHMSMSGNAFCNVMPSLIPFEQRLVGGVKVVTRYPERTPALDSKILLLDADSGEFLALMDGNWITAMRTGAVATYSIIHFAKTGYQTIGMLGLGNVARATMIVLASLTVGRELTIKLLRYKDQAELFAKRFKMFSHLTFKIVDTIEECIRESDVIVSCATYFEDDIALDAWFDEGTLVVPVHTRGFTNCDLFFDKVFADDKGHVDHFKNFSKFRNFAEVSDVINGSAVGRINDRERILVYNIGVSTHDINFASHIYDILTKDFDTLRGLKNIDMCEPIEKFWL